MLFGNNPFIHLSLAGRVACRHRSSTYHRRVPSSIIRGRSRKDPKTCAQRHYGNLGGTHSLIQIKHVVPTPSVLAANQWSRKIVAAQHIGKQAVDVIDESRLQKHAHNPYTCGWRHHQSVDNRNRTLKFQTVNNSNKPRRNRASSFHAGNFLRRDTDLYPDPPSSLASGIKIILDVYIGRWMCVDVRAAGNWSQRP